MPRDRSKIELTLFPFLSVLCGLIAVLILHIFVTMQSGRAQARGANGRGTNPSQVALLKDVEDRVKELARLQNEREQLLRLLELHKRPEFVAAAGVGNVGEPIGAPVPKLVQVIPVSKARIGVDKEAILVEVRSDGYHVHGPEGSQPTHYAPILLDPNGVKGPPSLALAKFLDSINSDRGKKYLLFLVTGDGVEALQGIKSYCEDHYQKKSGPNPSTFDIGVEPILSNWRVAGILPQQTAPKP